jgi:hypothetical protein
MKTPMKDRELLLLLKTGKLSEQALEKELYNLDELLTYTESSNAFCCTHELASRFSITGKKEKLSQYYRKTKLKAFYFLICKN